MREFVFATRLPRVVFGAGALRHLPRELEALGVARAFVLSTPGQLALGERVAELLGARSAGVCARAPMHVLAETARAARDEARRVGADGAVAVGGGSTTGLGKAIALETGLPVVAVPTTYAGSETRGDALVAAWLCRTVLGRITMGLRHKLCHTLSGSFNMPHARDARGDPAARARLQRPGSA